jgi:uncharacterized protein (DUF302 family)
MTRLLPTAIVLMLMTAMGHAGTMTSRPGWSVTDTKLSFEALAERLETAVKAEKMGLVTAASASDAAKAAGFTIPGNRVVGVYRNDFARRMLAASVSSGIEAPIRFYVTENPDGTATLSYKTPSTVFGPYFDEGKDALKALASELDAIFARISIAATK